MPAASRSITTAFVSCRIASMVAVADGLEKHRLHFEFWEQDRKLIEEARFFFIATSYKEKVDCSMRSGDPGFVKKPDRTS
jgi:hypothetical protein